MNIWLVTIGEPLPLGESVRKLRTGLVADRLVMRGHQVRWWVSAFEHQRKMMMFANDQEISPYAGLTLNILSGCGYEENISIKRYIDHRIVARKFSFAAPKLTAPDIIVSAIPCYHLAYQSVLFAKERDIPVIVDVRDLWPDIFIDVFKSHILRKFAKISLFFEYRRLQNSLRRADSILAMSEGILNWALSKAGRKRNVLDRVFYLGYKKSINRDAAAPGWLNGKGEKKIVAYIGTFGVSYELALVIAAARRFHESNRDDVCFVLAGTGEQERELRQKSQNLPNVIMPGWIQTDEIAYLLHHASLGVIPCRSVIDAMPNKTFEYLSAALPVVSSLEGETAHAIATHGMGINYKPGDERGLYEAVKTIIDNPSLRERMSKNAASFFDTKGDADKIYDDYIDHIEKVYKLRRGSGH